MIRWRNDGMPMHEEYKEFLFSKHILVSESAGSRDQVPDILLSLANLLNIRITSGAELADPQVLKFASRMMGDNVPEAFYKGFPQSVRKLDFKTLYYDQVISYFVTYGMGDFSEPRHSVFENEEDIRRSAFREEGSIKDFAILTEREAEEKIDRYVEDMFVSTRPLNDVALKVATLNVTDHGCIPEKIVSKTNAVRLLIATGNRDFGKFLMMSDVLKIKDEMHFSLTREMTSNKVNLPNRYRKLITEVMDQMFLDGRVDLSDCYEKKKAWSGLLHHIHYQAKTPDAKVFLAAMRGKANGSAYSEFEAVLQNEGPISAEESLLKTKGPGAVLRHLQYLTSRCRTKEELETLIGKVFDTKQTNTIILMQLLLMYGNMSRAGGTHGRTFQFVKFNLLRKYSETEEDYKKRRTKLETWQNDMLREAVEQRLRKVLKGRLGKVYIDPRMKDYAVPIKESASSGGLGVLAGGTRIHIGEHRKIRAFTYWEKVDDIDLSVIGMDEEGHQTEFSWRTMAEEQSEAITYSGDETSGYNGGSEYFDIIVPKFIDQHPGIRYLVFCDNVFSYQTFNNCLCKAGYMVRDEEDSGEIFEPKTVESSFSVTCPARFCYLFGIDLKENDFIWLNCADAGNVAVAGTTSMAFLIDKFHVTETLNMKMLFEMMAEETVSDPETADLAVVPESEKIKAKELIREYDFEKILALIG